MHLAVAAIFPCCAQLSFDPSVIGATRLEPQFDIVTAISFIGRPVGSVPLAFRRRFLRGNMRYRWIPCWWNRWSGRWIHRQCWCQSRSVNKRTCGWVFRRFISIHKPPMGHDLLKWWHRTRICWIWCRKRSRMRWICWFLEEGMRMIMTRLSAKLHALQVETKSSIQHGTYSGACAVAAIIIRHSTHRLSCSVIHLVEVSIKRAAW